MSKIFLLFFILITIHERVNLPVHSNQIELTQIGDFGITRKARPTVPEHLHTGIDVRRPSNNYMNEPILAITDGVVISKREDGPYAQLIIEHQNDETIYWTVYEHIAGIKVALNDHVNSGQEIARFMNREELNINGWQFDHFHLEILKKRPLKISPTEKNPFRHFRSFTLMCFTEEDLLDHFFDPIYFLRKN